MKNGRGGFFGSLLLAIVAIAVLAAAAYAFIHRSEWSGSAQNAAPAATSTATSTAAPDAVPPKVIPSSSSSPLLSEITVFIPKLNGSFGADDTLTIADASGTKWTVDYSDAVLYYEDETMDPPDWPGDFAGWITQSKAALASGKQIAPSAIKIVGTKDASGTLEASAIIQSAN